MLLLDFLYILVIILSLPLWLKFLFKKEYRLILKHRLSPEIKPGKKKRIWIHAVSVGEVKSLRSLIGQLVSTDDRDVVLSVTTPSGFEFAKKEYGDLNVRVINAPLDFSFTIKTFIKKVNPAILILNELEIWPNWILKTKKANIPILLINGRISERAFKRYKFFSFFLKHFVKRIDLFLVQAGIYKEKFAQLEIPPERIVVCGNIKADTAYDASRALPPGEEIWAYLKTGKNRNKKKILTLASSHLSDENIVIPAINRLREAYSVIIVPRHLNRIEEIERLLVEQKVTFARWSQVGSFDIGEQTLIFDKMGYLFNIFKISDIVLMGGTFDSKVGGHNLYEPAVLGKLIVGGPCYNNFPDIGRELVNRGVYKIITDQNRLVELLLNRETIDFGSVKKQAVEAVSRRRGSVNCIMKEIQTLISSFVEADL